MAETKPGLTWAKRLLISSTGVALLAVILVALNVLAGFAPMRLDITDEQLFTLSDGTQRILDELEQPITFKYYFSESLGSAPVQIKNYARKVREMLEEYETASDGMVDLEVYDPKPDTEEEEWAFKYGLQPVNMPDGLPLYFGMVAIAEEREVALPFFDPRRESFLEYDVSEAITRVTQTERKKLGILAFLNVSGGKADPTAPAEQQWAFVGELRKNYDVEFLLPTLSEIPEDVDVLMVIHPKFLPSKAVYAIDQFLLKGGRLMIFTDANARMDRQEQQKQGIRFTYSNIPDLFEGWGIEFDKTKIVGDQKLATRVNTAGQGVVDFPLWITVRGDRFNRDSVITSQLEEVTLIDAGAFSTTEDFKYEFTPLLKSSEASGLIDNYMAQMAGPLDIARTLETDGKERVLAALITGTFETALPNGPTPDPEQGQDPPPPPEEPPEGHIAKADGENTVMVVGDADFMADNFSVQRVNMFGRPIIQPINDNLIMVLNAVEFMAGDRNLIDIRSRGTLSRPFTTVLELQQQAQEQYQAEEEALTQRLEEVQARLEKLESANQEGGAEGERVLLNAEMLQELEQYREEERRTMKALRDVRRVLRQDIERLGRTLMAFNLLAVPLLVALVGFIGYYRRVKRSGGRK